MNPSVRFLDSLFLFLINLIASVSFFEKSILFSFINFRIVEASTLPMSIIIIGIGDSDFSKMDQLDGDGGLLTDSAGNTAVRDIVHFVEFNKYSEDITYLHEDVLREIPRQMVSYMSMNGIRPQPNEHAVIS